MRAASQLEKIGRRFDAAYLLEISMDTVYRLEEISAALETVQRGTSRGQTLIKILKG